MRHFVADNLIIEASTLAEAEYAAEKYTGTELPVRDAIYVRMVKGQLYVRTFNGGCLDWKVWPTSEHPEPVRAKKVRRPVRYAGPAAETR